MLRWRKDPQLFFRQVLNTDPWDHQVLIAESVRDNRQTAVKACHASGKDYIAARIALWFATCYRPSKVITTAPTDRQVRKILWQEIAVAHRKARVPLGGRLLTQEWQLDDGHFMLGFSASDHNPDAFQGYHADHVLVIFDEANGITADIRAAADGILSAGHTARLLEIGNPTDPSSAFAGKFTLEHVNRQTISAFSTPNFTQFGIKREHIETGEWRAMVQGELIPAPYLINPEWVEEKWIESGRRWDDPFIQSRILGEFPAEDADAVFTLSLVEEALAAEPKLKATSHRDLACDVARYGDDETVIGFREGMHYRELESYRGKGTAETANRLIHHARQLKIHRIKVDDDGVGGGVVDSLQEKLRGKGIQVIRMINGGASSDERFKNNRAKWHWDLRTLMLNKEVSIDAPVTTDLCAVRIKRYDERGRMILKSKDELKKELGRSPDHGDCVIYAFAEIEETPLQIFV